VGPKDAFTTLCSHVVAQSIAFMFVTISVTALTSLEWAAREIFWPPLIGDAAGHNDPLIVRVRRSLCVMCESCGISFLPWIGVSLRSNLTWKNGQRGCGGCASPERFLAIMRVQFGAAAAARCARALR
jgi:hypothetical protein